MKKTILTIAVALLGFVALANTNTLTTVPEEKEYGKWEMTLGGGGDVNPKTGDSVFGADVSLAHNPLQSLPSLWFGVNQSLYWEPEFAGSTDLYSEWAWHLYGDLYVNTGWSVGALYDKSFDNSTIWRTGPQVEFEYYLSDSTFLVTSLNYDFPSRGDSDFRYSFGIGFTW